MNKRVAAMDDHNKEHGGKHQKLMAPDADDIDPINFARSYQIEALEKAIKQNTIVYLETGSGKTLIAIMLIRYYGNQIRKPSPFVAVFLAPTVHLVGQQSEVVKMHTDLKVGKYWGELGVDFWDASTWENEMATHEVLVMTPRILLDALRHGFFGIDRIKLLIFDECHNARGNSDYACILKEFYHPQYHSTPTRIPRIFGMTACLVKSKGAISPEAYAKQILEFENLMNSKVFTVANESVLAKFIPFSTPKVKLYDDVELPHMLYVIEDQLVNLKLKYLKSMKEQNSSDASKGSAVKNVNKLCETFCFCVKDLGLWLAYQAAKVLSNSETVVYFWEEKDGSVDERIVQSFSQAVCGIFLQYIPSGPTWSISKDCSESLNAGLLTSRVNCLIESLMEYRQTKELRCIIFVERVVTAIALNSLLSEVVASNGWTTTYMAGSTSGLNSQRRKEHFNIIDLFRKGAVNIIVATQILEEGLDVQRCNLVIRFDPSKTVCSFIQSRGRARMEGSDYLLIIKSGDTTEFSRVNNYLASGEIMREESLRYASLPCAPPKNRMCDEELYRVESTGALATLSSSIALIYYYCSQLPSDRYFTPTPRFIFDDEFNKCTLHLPNSCPLQTVCAQGPKNVLKSLVCLKACQKLHEIGALTDNLLPVSFDNEIKPNSSGDTNIEEKQANYFPGELVSIWHPHSEDLYHCYRITMKKHYDYEVPFSNIILAVKFDLGNDFTHTDFELVVSRGSVTVDIAYSGSIHLDAEQVYMGTKFQISVLRLLIDRNMNKLADSISSLQENVTLPRVTYLLLPSINTNRKSPVIDWDCVSSFIPTTAACSRDNMLKLHKKSCFGRNHVHCIRTYDKVVCRCMLVNSLVVTPHNGYVYCISDILDELDGNSLLKSNKEAHTYKDHYRSKHGIYLKYDEEPLLRARRSFTVQNYLRKQQCNSEKESTTAWVELPPELCCILLSNISLDTLYSFSMLPSIMHRVESILLAINLKILQIAHPTRNDIPTMKVLEAITTKKCQEGFSLETLETLGDSFLKYAVSQQLYKSNEYHHEGLLTSQRERIVSNNALCKLACKRNLQGFIRLECFDPKFWVIPGDSSECPGLKETSTKIYTMGTREMKSKVIADVVEALIGAYLVTGGELSALFFMNWLGIEVDFIKQVPSDNHLVSQPDRHVSVIQLESILNHSFRDSSYLVEALTHGSYQLQEIPRCYQRLEFLGDSVLDYLITDYMYTKYPGISPGQLTNLRSSAVNNDCYALAAIKSGLHKHILHMSSLLHEQMKNFMASNDHLLLVDTCGWESETSVPKVLGDIIESLAGAILIDSGYDKDTVWKCIRPILEPLATLDSMKIQPIVELENLCRSKGYESETRVGCVDGETSITVEVKADGVLYSDTRSGMKKKEGKKLAAKAVLRMLKENMAKNC
ncbi:hypothetical protein ACHQM5_006678 [Ranunculus cassubicifolius]